jgi:hypothetical protein
MFLLPRSCSRNRCRANFPQMPPCIRRPNPSFMYGAPDTFTPESRMTRKPLCWWWRPTTMPRSSVRDQPVRRFNLNSATPTSRHTILLGRTAPYVEPSNSCGSSLLIPAQANYAIAQALVTDISYANASFYGCDFASFQDTWYTGRNGSTYVTGGTVYGQTDYLFGFGTAWFQNVTLANRACGGGITAWKGTNQTDAPGNRYGVYIADSQIIRSPDANATTATTGLCYLGWFCSSCTLAALTD